jgi:hypothetical protein
MASRTAANHDGYRQAGDGYRADRSACLRQSRDRRRDGMAATVVLAPDVASGQGLQPVKGSGPG